jgi:hypothetical protein
VAGVLERNIPTERPLVGEVSAIFADRGCYVVSMTDPYGRILGFLDWNRYFYFQVSPQLYSRGWVNPVPDPLLLRKSGSAGNWTRTTGSVARNSDHRPRRSHRLWGLPSLIFNGYRWPFHPGINRSGYESDNSPPISAEVKNRWSIHHSPLRLHGVVIS